MRPAAGTTAALAALLLLASSGLARGEVVLRESRNEYELHGTTVAELRGQLEGRLRERASAGGAISHGLTRAEWDARYEVEPATLPAGCSLARIEVRLTILTTLPVWRPSGRVERRLAPQVESMIAGLARHEAGHRAHTIEAARALDAALRRLGPRADCRAMRRAAQQLVSRAMLRLRTREWAYDQATAHGKRQGSALEYRRP